MRDDGTEMNWGLTAPSLKNLLKAGYVRVGRATPKKPQKYEISYLTSGRISDIETGRATVTGRNKDGSVQAEYVTHKMKYPVTSWSRPSHNAEVHGTELVKSLLGDKIFPYPIDEQESILRPDFIFFNMDEKGAVRANIVDPHGDHLADSLPKLVGLANYAEAHANSYGRIVSVSKSGGVFRCLDLKDQEVREAIKLGPSAKALFGGQKAKPYPT